MNKLKKIVVQAMNKRASEWKLGKLIAEDIEQEKKLQGSIPIPNYAVYWNIQVFNDMKELDVPQLSKKAQDAIFDDIKVALQGGFSKGEIQLQKEDLEEEDIKILNKDLLLEFFLNFEEKDLSLDDVEIDLGNTYDGLPESYVKFRQLANKKKQVSKMASIISKEILKSAGSIDYSVMMDIPQNSNVTKEEIIDEIQHLGDTYNLGLEDMYEFQPNHTLTFTLPMEKANKLIDELENLGFRLLKKDKKDNRTQDEWERDQNIYD